MPILKVEIVAGMDCVVPDDLAQRIADEVARLLDSGPRGTWVSVTALPEGSYAENQGRDPKEDLPVFVSLVAAEPPVGAARVAKLRELTRAIAAACGRRVENVHIVIEPPAAGRIAFGGVLRE